MKKQVSHDGHDEFCGIQPHPTTRDDDVVRSSKDYVGEVRCTHCRLANVRFFFVLALRNSNRRSSLFSTFARKNETCATSVLLSLPIESQLGTPPSSEAASTNAKLRAKTRRNAYDLQCEYNRALHGGLHLIRALTQCKFNQHGRFFRKKLRQFILSVSLWNRQERCHLELWLFHLNTFVIPSHCLHSPQRFLSL